MVTMKRISTPPWASPFSRSVDENFPALDKLLARHEQIIGVVDVAVQRYIDVISATGRSGFPQLDRLTGEFYIREESFWICDEPWFQRVGRSRGYRFSVFACCLEHSVRHDQAGADYLGLEVHFLWHPEGGLFVHEGDVDSSSI